MFCRHKWKLLSETVTKSIFEHAVELTSGHPVKLPGQLCWGERKHIQVFTCEKCGKLKRFVENI